MAIAEKIKDAFSAGATKFGENVTRGSDAAESAYKGISDATSGIKAAVSKVQKDLESKRQTDTPMPPRLPDLRPNSSDGIDLNNIRQAKKGGHVRKSGVFFLHKGETVLPASVVKRIEKKRKATRRSGRR